MKAKKSPVSGHVIIDVDAAGVKLLAKGTTQPPYQAEEHTQFLASLEERASKPLALDPPATPWHFAIHS